jgi:uncharacterized protein YcfJ
MKRVALFSLLAAAGLAAQAETFVDNARVRSVDPQYENVQVPRNECSTQQVYEQQQRPVQGQGGPNMGGLVIGAVAGGLLGNQVGKGHGREAATAAGAVAGAYVGNSVAGGNRGYQVEQVPRDVTTCRTVNDVQARLTGYRVTYEYRGHQYATVMRRDPGPTVPVRVSVEPVEPVQQVQPEYHRRH